MERQEHIEESRRSRLSEVRRSLCRVFLQDWLYLALLGVVSALCSYIIDYCIDQIRVVHSGILTTVGGLHVSVVYLLWTLFAVVLVVLAVIVVQWLSLAAIGSGIPEMKTVLEGASLKQYLTKSTLAAKMLGVTLCLGAGLPIGKEGPFVHIAGIVGIQLNHLHSKMRAYFRRHDAVEDDVNYAHQMIAAGCAVGVACVFGAPVGGVLFSIEVTSIYFAVRNYWRCFFAAVCSALVFHLLAVWFHQQLTVVAYYPTSFATDYPFDPLELVAFSLLGAFCGFASVLWVSIHRAITNIMTRESCVRKILSQHVLIYPVLTTFLVTTLRFPPGFGQFMGGGLMIPLAVQDLFTNFTWVTTFQEHKSWNLHEQTVYDHWASQHSLFLTLALYGVSIFLLSALCNTLPIPAGVFMPVFTSGAAFGRLLGEGLAVWFPDGMRSHGAPSFARIVPGAYAVVGAAALAGGVTHSISVCVIVFELTGSVTYSIPVLLAVLIANSIATRFQLSIYDSIIELKNLPCLAVEHASDQRKLSHFTAGNIMDCDVISVNAAWSIQQRQQAVVDSSGTTPVSEYVVVNDDAFVGVLSRDHLNAWIEAADPKSLDIFSTPLIVSEHARLSDIRRTLAMMGTDHAYVVRRLSLAGVVTAERIRQLLLTSRSRHTLNIQEGGAGHNDDDDDDDDDDDRRELVMPSNEIGSGAI